MKPQYLLLSAALMLLTGVDTALAYGSSSSASSCHKPVFSEFQPAPNKYIQSFREFSFIASSNTVHTSLQVTVSAGQNKEHFSAKQLEVTQKKSGQFEVEGKIDRPFQHGFVRVSVTAHSKPGCEQTEGYLLRVQ